MPRNQRRYDLTGQRFRRLLVTDYIPGTRRVPAKWVCQCDCGQVTRVAGHELMRGSTVSCGCMQEENRGQSTRARVGLFTEQELRLLRFSDRLVGWRG